MGECFLYDAFISYRHSIPDSLIAQKLHRALETYKTPSALVKKGAPRKLRKVFRDREELPTSGNLSGDIREALENSEFLIVICSPRTPESKWVMEEIETFKKLGREDKILAILIEGEPDDSFPPALRERSHHCIDADGKDIKQSVEIEPLAADIRASSLKKSLHLLKNEKLRLLAPILKCRFDDLKQRHRERFIRQIAITAVGLVSFLTVFSMFSFYQWKNTEKARDTALRNRSKALAILSQQQTKSNNSTLGVLLALEALPQDLAHPDKPYVAEAEDALYQALVNLRQRCILDAGEGNNFRAASYTPDGQRLVTLDKTHLRFWDVNTGQLLEELDKSYLKNVYFSGRFDYSPGSDYMLPPDGNNTEIWDSKGNIVTDLKERPFCFGSNGEVVTVKEIKPDNKAHHSNKLTRWDVLGNELNSIILPLCQKSIISPNGDYELGFDENATCLRDTHTGQVLIDAGTGGGEYGKFDLSFSPDSRRFAIADNEKKVIHVWDIKEKREIAALAEQAKVTAFSPNGKFLVAKAKNNVGCLWDVDQAQPMMVLGSPQDLIDSAEFSPDGRYVAVVLRDHSVHMWDMSSLHEAFSLARNQELTEVRFSPDGKQFLTLSLGEPKNISLWNMDISNQITLYKSPNGKNGAIYPQFNSNGESIVIEDYSHSIDTRDIYLWDTVTGQKTDLLGGDQTRYYQYLMSPDRRLILTYNYGLWEKYLGNSPSKPVTNESGRLWDAKTGKMLAVLPADNRAVVTAVFSPNGKYAGTINCDLNKQYSYSLWEAETSREICSAAIEEPGGKSNGVYSSPMTLNFSPDNKMVLFCTSNRRIEIRRAETGLVVTTLEIPGDEKHLFDAVFLKDGSGVITGSTDGIRRWDLKTGEQLYHLDPGPGEDGQKKPYFSSFNLSSDDKRIVGIYALPSQPAVHYGRLWDAQTGQLITDLARPDNATKTMNDAITNAIFTPDGQKIIASFGVMLQIGTVVKILNANDGKKILQFDAIDEVGKLILSPDSKRLLIIASNIGQNASLWSTDTGQQLDQFFSQEGILSAEFSQDGSRICAGSTQGTLRIWRVFPTGQKLIDYARCVVPRQLTAEERDTFGLNT